MPTQFASCPCCGMTVPLRALNFEEDGTRVAAPAVYGTFLKTRYSGGGYKGLRWEAVVLPKMMLCGLRAQLVTALAVVDAQLEGSVSELPHD